MTNAHHVFVGHQLSIGAVLLQQIIQVQAINVLHDVVVEAILIVRVINLGDVRVSPRGNSARLLQKTLGVTWSSAITRINHFDGDRALEFDVPPVIDESHATAAQNSFDAKVRQLTTNECVIL